MSKDAGNRLEPQTDSPDPELESAMRKAAQDLIEHCEAAGGIENVDILALLADAVSPIKQCSDPSRVLQAVYATVTLGEFLTLKMFVGDRLSVDQIAQRQGRSAEAVRLEIRHSSALIRLYQPRRSTGDS